MSRTGSHEREIKLRVGDAEEGRRRLLGCGFGVSRERIFESNAVLDTPEGAVRGAGCLLRVRTTGAETVVTWKGPGEAGVHKVREEVEFTTGDGAAARLLFERLGYQLAFVYEKYRTEFAHGAGGGSAVLDETPVGTFLELEGEAEWIDRFAEALGFGTSDYVTASYGELYRAWCAAHGLPVGHMTFTAVR